MGCEGLDWVVKGLLMGWWTGDLVLFMSLAFLLLKMRNLGGGGGCIAQWIAYLLPTQWPRVTIPVFPIISEEIMKLLR